MCQTNSSRLLCGVPVERYIYPRHRLALVFCDTIKGRIVHRLLATKHDHDLMACRHQGMGADYHPEAYHARLDSFLYVLWRDCQLDFPGLLRFRPKWVELVLAISAETCRLRSEDTMVTGMAVWARDATKAWAWFQQQLQQPHQPTQEQDECFTSQGFVDASSQEQQQEQSPTVSSVQGFMPSLQVDPLEAASTVTSNATWHTRVSRLKPSQATRVQRGIQDQDDGDRKVKRWIARRAVVTEDRMLMEELKRRKADLEAQHLEDGDVEGELWMAVHRHEYEVLSRRRQENREAY